MLLAATIFSLQVQMQIIPIFAFQTLRDILFSVSLLLINLAVLNVCLRAYFLILNYFNCPTHEMKHILAGIIVNIEKKLNNILFQALDAFLALIRVWIVFRTVTHSFSNFQLQAYLLFLVILCYLLEYLSTLAD